MDIQISSRLASLKTRMTEAYDSAEWQVLAELDKECQLTIKQIINENPRAMYDELRQMLGFYATIIKQCEQQRDGFASEARLLRTNIKHQKTYSQLQTLQ